jgi:hypothetical protein
VLQLDIFEGAAVHFNNRAFLPRVCEMEHVVVWQLKPYNV